MAYVVGNPLHHSESTNTTVTGLISGDAQQDDIVLAYSTRSGGTAHTAPGGWTNLYSDINSSASCWWKKMGVTPDTSIVLTKTSNANTNVFVTTIVIRGADGTTPVATSANAANTLSAPSVTPTAANSLVILSAQENNISFALQAKPGPMYLGSSTGGSCQHFFGWYSFGASATGTRDFAEGRSTAATPVVAQVVLNDDGTGKRRPSNPVDTPASDLVHPYGTDGEGGSLVTTGSYSPIVEIPTINDGGGNAITTRYQAFSNQDGILTSGIRSTIQSPTSSPGTGVVNVNIAGSQLASTPAWASKLLAYSISLRYTFELRPYRDLEFVFGLSDGTNSRIFRTGGGDTRPNPKSGIFPVVIDAAGGFEAQDIGTVSLASANRVIMGQSWLSSNQAYNIGPLHLLNTMVIAGDSSVEGFRANFITAVEIARNLLLNTAQNQGGQTDSQVVAFQSIQVGDGGTNPVYFDGSGQAFAFPGAYNEAGLYVQAMIAQGALALTLYAGSADTINISNVAFDGGDFHGLTIHPSWNASGTLVEDGAVISSATVTLNDIGRAFQNITFTGCKELTANAADLSGGGVILEAHDSSADQAITVTSQADLDALDSVTFRNNARAIRITGNHAALTLPANSTFSGNTVDVRYEGTTNLTLTKPASVTGTVTVQQGGTGTITLVSAATITIQGALQSGDVYRVYNTTDAALVEEGTATGTTKVISAVVDNGDNLDCVVARGGANTLKRFEASATVVSGSAVFNVALAADGARVANDTTALAYTGIAMTGSTITVSQARTIQELYDYSRARSNQLANLDDDVALTTADGVTFQVDGGYAITVTGASASLISETQALDTVPTVAAGALYEASDGVVWEDGGSLYYAKHAWYNTKDAATSTNQQNIVIAVWDTDNNNDAVYTTGRVNGAIASDAGGLVEAYIVYRVDATTWTLEQQALGYGFAPLVFPLSSNGSQIGSPSADSILRLTTDSRVTLSRAAALALAGITYTHGADEINHNSLTLSQVQDHTKAKQYNTADIEAGKAGYVSYYEEGLILSFDGSVYNQATAWTSQNVGDTTATLKGGSIELGAPGNINQHLDSISIDYTAAGTYDHRGETMDGTITLSNSSGGAVTAQFDPAVTIVNNGPSITVEQNVAESVTAANLIDGTKVLLWNATQAAELDIAVVAGGSGYSTNITVGVGQEAESGDTIELYAAYASGTTYKLPIKAQAQAGLGGIAFVDTQSAWTEVEAWSLDGSLMTEFTLDVPNIDVDLATVGTTTQKKRLAAFWAYQLTQDDGIRNFWDAFSVLSSSEIRQNVDIIDVLIHNTGSTNVEFTDDDVRYYRSDGSLPYDTTGNSIFMDYAGVPFVVETGASGVVQQDIDDISSQTGQQLLDNQVIETGFSMRQALRLLSSVIAGKVSKSGNTFVFRDLNDTKDRVTAVTDADGQRTSVTKDAA